MIVHRQLESAPVTVSEVELEQAIVALIAFGAALSLVAFAYFVGFLVGRLS